MAVQTLPSITRTPGAQDDYPFFILRSDNNSARDITNDLIEVVVGDDLNSIILSVNSNDATQVEKDDPTNGGWTLHISPDFLPSITGTLRYQVRLTLNTTAPGATSVVIGVGAFTITAPMFKVPDFTLVPASPSLVLVAGDTDIQNVDAISNNFYAGTVALSTVVDPIVTDGPTAGITTPAIVPSGGSDTQILTTSTVGITPPGDYTITITGTDGGLTRTAVVTLTVT